MQRLRIFAGPNGSGKTTLVSRLRGTFNFGSYINADDLKSHFDSKKFLNFDEFLLNLTNDILQKYWAQHPLKEQAPLNVHIDSNILIANQPINSYHTAIIASFLRNELLKTHQSFTFETVFSHPSKLEIIDRAKNMDYRTYLYFVATNASCVVLKKVDRFRA